MKTNEIWDYIGNETPADTPVVVLTDGGVLRGVERISMNVLPLTPTAVSSPLVFIHLQQPAEHPSIDDAPRFPPSSDMVEFSIVGDKVTLYCLICASTIGDANYLNEAILLWHGHCAEKKPH